MSTNLSSRPHPFAAWAARHPKPPIAKVSAEMNEEFRQCMAWLHIWTSSVVGWIVFFVFVTGTTSYTAYEIDRWLCPELSMFTPELQSLSAQQMHVRRQYLEANAEQARSRTIQQPGGSSQSYLRVYWQETLQGTSQHGRVQNATLDAETGQAVPSDKVRAIGSGQSLVFAYQPGLDLELRHDGRVLLGQLLTTG